MSVNPQSTIDILLDLSRRFARVSTIPQLLDAVAAYPRLRGASLVVLLSLESDTTTDPQRLCVLDCWSEAGSVAADCKRGQRLALPSALIELRSVLMRQAHGFSQPDASEAEGLSGFFSAL